MKNPATVADEVTTCQRLDELLSIRLRNDGLAPAHVDNDELRTTIRAIFGEELDNQPSLCSGSVNRRAAAPGLWEIVQEDLGSLSCHSTAPLLNAVTKPSNPFGTSRTPLSLLQSLLNLTHGLRNLVLRFHARRPTSRRCDTSARVPHPPASMLLL